jgi:hypothetical protein
MKQSGLKKDFFEIALVSLIFVKFGLSKVAENLVIWPETLTSRGVFAYQESNTAQMS